MSKVTTCVANLKVTKTEPHNGYIEFYRPSKGAGDDPVLVSLPFGLWKQMDRPTTITATIEPPGVEYGEPHTVLYLGGRQS